MAYIYNTINQNTDDNDTPSKLEQDYIKKFNSYIIVVRNTMLL